MERLGEEKGKISYCTLIKEQGINVVMPRKLVRVGKAPGDRSRLKLTCYNTVARPSGEKCFQ